MNAYGILMSSAAWMIESPLNSIDQLSSFDLAGVEVVKKLLLLGLLARFGNVDAKCQLGAEMVEVYKNDPPITIVFHDIFSDGKASIKSLPDFISESLNCYDGHVMLGDNPHTITPTSTSAIKAIDGSPARTLEQAFANKS